MSQAVERVMGSAAAVLPVSAGRSGLREWLGGAIYPPGATNANWFGLFNGICWQITLGSPLILYAKSQGASATLLGVIAALTPLLVIFQIPAAHYLPKYGYRRFILAGWGSRTICIFALVAVPVLWFAAPSAKLALVVALLFVFNLLRGLASGAWMPWITELIPEHLRGRFLSRDQVFGQVGCLAALVASALVLSGNPKPWQFSTVFLISAVGGTLSLLFLTRMPDVTAPEKMKASGLRVPWVQMLRYPPFFRLMIYNLLANAIVGGLPVFTVAFLKGRTSYLESDILWFSTLGMVASLLTVNPVGHFLDRHGSRPVLRACMLVFIAIVIGWWLVAAGVVLPGVFMLAALHFLYGVANINHSVANSRIIMGTMPPMGRNHFFAMFTVITSLALGLSPILWGLLLDAVGAREWHGLFPSVSWNRYSIYFALVCGVCVAAAIGVSFLQENACRIPKHAIGKLPPLQKPAA